MWQETLACGHPCRVLFDKSLPSPVRQTLTYAIRSNTGGRNDVLLVRSNGGKVETHFHAYGFAKEACLDCLGIRSCASGMDPESSSVLAWPISALNALYPIH